MNDNKNPYQRKLPSIDIRYSIRYEEIDEKKKYNSWIPSFDFLHDNINPTNIMVPIIMLII